MGATSFTATGKGDTMQAAFVRARDQAQYEYGHAGYTGTIAEKPEAIKFPLPTGVSPEDFADAAFQATPYWTVDPATRQVVERAGKTPAWVTDGSYPLATWRRVVKISCEKWGPCVGVQSGPNEWYFFGTASE